MRIFKHLLFISFLIFNSVYSQQSSSSGSPTTCRAVTFSGAGDRGSWEVGVLRGITNVRQPEEYKWQFATGISAGSINAAAMAMFSVGDELSAVEFLQNQWLILNKEDVYVDWKGGLMDGLLFQAGIFNTAPLLSYLGKLINTTLLNESDRGLLIGATNLDTGVFNRFNKTDPDITTGVVASSSIPGVFPYTTKNGYQYCDGGVSYMTPISDTVRLCYDTGATDVIVDVILQGGLEPIVNVSSFHTLDVLLRTGEIITRNFHLKDIEEVYAAFPNAILNIYTPSQKLPGYYLGFQYSAEMIKMGIIDGENKPTM